MNRLTRRGFITAGAALAASPVSAREHADLTLILMGDLHSGYRWSSRLLAAVRQAAGSASGEVRIIVNGDVFEHNNVVARKNGGLIDLALLRSFSAIAPTFVTIGNHDSDLFDPALFASDVLQSGAVLLTDIVDPRTARPYGSVAARFTVGRCSVAIAALGTPLPSLYPAAYRAFYQVPNPVAYARTALPVLLDDADLKIVLIHAGFVADRSVMPHLRGDVLLHGSHDHLRFTHPFATPDARGLHIQSGSWSNAFQIVDVRFRPDGPTMKARDVVLDSKSTSDPELQALVQHELDSNLGSQDKAVLGHLGRAFTLDESALLAARWIREQAGADVGIISHTTCGDGFPSGAVTRYDLSAFLRFDGNIVTVEIPPERVALLSSRCNQFDGHTPYDRRTGDYLYATPFPIRPVGSVKVAINAYPVSSNANRLAFLGWDATEISPTKLPLISQIIADGLARS